MFTQRAATHAASASTTKAGSQPTRRQDNVNSTVAIFTRYARDMTAATDFMPLNLCVLTVSDTRTPDNDSSGDFLAQALAGAGHRLHARRIERDNRYRLRAIVAEWIADEAVHGVLVTGGTGFTGRDSTPEAIAPLLDKEMPGFGELFRMLSFDEIGTSSLQSRAFAGLANNTFVFCLPGSTSACRTAWEKLIAAQLDARTKPCNLAGLMPRLREK
jgi:molybdenum cofactor biosynthesis protein B